ncbi:LLM class F420-dependent oxidoreductase [Nocardia sp. NBC_00565]|uniref:LLM class F420-dependent oxidoreductase n=1 Tax=Nocardia sp. NBC_00565 TaxID=2975993 RepID=UPI002E805622|nr:LLM class F420-dependent oxidoreductase [Nocardia sp. NBC_00565]WUC06669.1 LLM class F420-dependent oxidoreductase [Nocardia sp. NBC_00565]
MQVDANIGGSIDGTGGGDLAVIDDQVGFADRLGYDGVWSTEVGRDPFLPLLAAAQRSSRLQLGTAVAVAFARNPMTTATVANDLHAFSSGRFILGLGSQIEAHIVRRFSMPWSAPADRMREFISALRAIWRSWQLDEKLDFRGDFYQHTLMTPMFRPEPNPWGSPPVLLAAVGPKMTRVAAEVADGLILHGFTTERYLREATIPLIESGLNQSERARGDFTVSYPGLLVTGATDQAFEQAMTAVRKQIAFYGATPAYRPVLELHGWGDLHTELHRLSKAGAWSTMTTLIDDTVLNTFAVVGEPGVIGTEIMRRFADIVDRFTLYTPYPLDESVRRTIIDDLHDPAHTPTPSR